MYRNHRKNLHSLGFQPALKLVNKTLSDVKFSLLHQNFKSLISLAKVRWCHLDTCLLSWILAWLQMYLNCRLTSFYLLILFSLASSSLQHAIYIVLKRKFDFTSVSLPVCLTGWCKILWRFFCRWEPGATQSVLVVFLVPHCCIIYSTSAGRNTINFQALDCCRSDKCWWVMHSLTCKPANTVVDGLGWYFLNEL